jgi:hypothetical protein
MTRERAQRLPRVGHRDKTSGSHERWTDRLVFPPLENPVVDGNPRPVVHHRLRRPHGVDRLDEHGVARRPSRRQRDASVPAGGGRQLRVTARERRIAGCGIGPWPVDVGHEHGPSLHRRSHRDEQRPILGEDPPLHLL